MGNTWYFGSRLFIFLIFILMNGLAFRSLSRWVPRLNQKGFRIGYWTLAVLSLLPLPIILTSGFISWGTGDWLVRTAYYLALSWNVGQFGIVLLLPIIYGIHRHWNRLNDVSEKTAEVPGEDPVLLSRREFIEKVLWGLPLLAMGAAFKWVVVGDWEMVLRKVPLAYPNLSPALDGLKIAQISDLHMGTFFSLEKLDRALALIEKESPDLLVVTGDLSSDLTMLKSAVERLTAFKSRIPHGIYCVMGNHEHYRNVKEVQQIFGKSPIPLLINENRKVIDGPQPFYLLGVDYPFYNKRGNREKFRLNFVEKASAKVPDNAFTVLLAHHPDFIHEGFEKGFDLTLSGHTHGGQIALFGYPLLTPLFQYINGLYQNNSSYGFVSSGLGHWLPFRIGLPLEIVMFTLKKS